MKYSTGSIGRVFSLTFEHGDSFADEFKNFVKKENVRNGYAIFLGALEKARIVSGPKDTSLPAVPDWKEFADGREVVGTANIMWADGEPKVHIHVVAGRGGDVLVGCLREDGKVMVVIEAVVFEVTGLGGLEKSFDEKTGAFLPVFKD